MPKPIAPSPINATFLGFSAACTILCWGVCSSSSVVLLFFIFGAATLMLIVFSHICTPMGEPVSNVVPYVKSWTQKIMNPKKLFILAFPSSTLWWFGVKESENGRLRMYYLYDCSIILTSKPACRCYNTQNSHWHQTLWNCCSKPNQVIVYQEPSYDPSTFAETLKDGSWAIWKLLIFLKNTENLDSIYLWFYTSTGMGIGRWPNNEVIDILSDPTTYQQTGKQKKPNFLKKEQTTTSFPLTTTSAAPPAKQNKLDLPKRNCWWAIDPRGRGKRKAFASSMIKPCN